MFTQQHHKAVAEVFKAGMPVVNSAMMRGEQERTIEMLHHHNWLVGRFADMLMQDDTAFEYKRFFEACGWEV